MADEQFLIFNVTNPEAMRDNIRQSALELSLVSRMLETVSFAASDCTGVVAPSSTVRFDTSKLVLMGHSMGATIAPLVLGTEPRIRAGVLSGAGASWIENVVYKQKPIPTRPIAETLLRYGPIGRQLDIFDPTLSLLQWAGESADPPQYARHIVQEPIAPATPRHVLMFQGIVDRYILPSIANSTSLSIGLDLGGPALDMTVPEISSFLSATAVLPLVGRMRRDLPVRGNLSNNTVTGVVVQHLEDGIEDGHEVMFQTEAPKYQYRCFLESLATGIPQVPADGRVTDNCP